jgi:hypothetical protein
MIRRSPSSDSYALLARMILEAAGLGSALALVACGGGVVVEDEDASSGGGGTGAVGSSSSSTSGPGSTGPSGTTGPGSTSVASSSSGNQPWTCNDPAATTYACFNVDAICPEAGSGDAAAILGEMFNEDGPCPEEPEFCWCSTKVSSVSCGPDPSPPAGECCYFLQVVSEEICMGRPFTIDGEGQVGSLARGSGWAAEPSSRSRAASPGAAARPDMARLDAAARARLAAAWSRDALFEHASVASFARFALELMAVGAPADLVRGAQQAMGEEIRHAELCFGLASAFADEPIGPGPLPIDGALERRALAEIAAAVVREGCVGETIAALLAGAARDAATDPAVRSALDEIANDEAAHAALAWRAVAWACERSADVRQAVEAAFAAAEPPAIEHEEEDPTSEALLSAFGRLSARARRDVAARAFAEVVRPCARALLSRSHPIEEADTLDARA